MPSFQQEQQQQKDEMYEETGKCEPLREKYQAIEIWENQMLNLPDFQSSYYKYAQRTKGNNLWRIIGMSDWLSYQIEIINLYLIFRN